MVKSSYEQLGITCGLPSPVESESALLDFSSEAFFSAFAGDDLSRMPAPVTAPAARETIARDHTPAPTEAQPTRFPIRKSTSGSVVNPSDGTPADSDKRSAMIACYDRDDAPPRIEVVTFSDAASYIDVVSLAVMNCVADLGGGLTPEVVYELVSNLSHADFTQPVISVLDSGDTIRVADSGPGIPNKSAAMRRGFTSASASQRDVIRGAGAGLPLVLSLVESLGGFLVIDDNIGGGTVVTASVNEQSPSRYSPLSPATPVSTTQQSPFKQNSDQPPRVSNSVPSAIEAPGDSRSPRGELGESGSGRIGAATPPNQSAPAVSLITTSSATVRGVPLSDRQREVLSVVADSLEAGPSTVSTLLDIPLSTAYRDLKFLEDRGLISSLGNGKRQVTGMGMELLRVF